MKTVKLIFSIFLFLSFYTNDIAAQRTSIQYSKRMEIEIDTKEKYTEIKVPENGFNLKINVQSKIFAGKLKMELIDPKGEKQRNFTIESKIEAEWYKNLKDKSKIEESIGQTTFDLNTPEVGIWIVKIISENVIGQVYINASMNKK